MRKRILAAGAAAFMAAGCGAAEKEPQTVTGSSEAPKAYTQPQQPLNKKPSSKPDQTKYAVPHTVEKTPQDVKEKLEKDPVFKSLDKYQKRIITERRARVARGVCVVWAKNDGIEATLNPGSAKAKAENGDEIYYPVYNSVDSTNLKYPLTPKSGPLSTFKPDGRVIDDGALITIFYRADGSSNESVRKLSDQPIKDATGRVYFEDKATGEPLMLTDRANLEFNPASAVAACRALIHQEPFPNASELTPQYSNDALGEAA